MCMSNTNASDKLFGWDFQINAAIVLMLEDIDKISRVRVEGATEDIELTMTNGGYVYSQAKSIVKSTDHRNVKRNLIKGLKTLNAASANDDCIKLVYITNSNNPLKDDTAMSIFYGPSKRSYDSLPNSSKKVIDDILAKQSFNEVDKSKLYIYTLPFETDDLRERYKVVIEKVKDFISSVKPYLSGIAQDILDIWQQQLFQNATFHDTELVITKEDLIWPMIVILSDNERTNPFIDEIDDGEYNEICERYKSFIDCKSQKFTFTTRVLSAFQAYQPAGITGNERILTFINEHWMDYSEDFTADISKDLTETLIKITLYRLLLQRHLINEIKKKVNL